jgi:hypothetical protein
MVAGAKHSCFRGQCYKTFKSVIYKFLYLASVCWTRLEKLARDKLITEISKLLTNKFYNIGPGIQN